MSKKIPAVVDVKLVQTTLTQICSKDSPSVTQTYCETDTELGQESKKRKSGPTIYHWSLKSKINGYGMRYDDPQHGDIIMAKAGDINHPAYLSDIVSRNYYVFGSVRGFCYIINEMEYVRNISYSDDDECGDERLEVVWVKVAGSSTTAFTPPSRKCIHMVAKAGDAILVGMNDFIIEHVNAHYFHKENEGWLPYKW